MRHGEIKPENMDVRQVPFVDIDGIIKGDGSFTFEKTTNTLILGEPGGSEGYGYGYGYGGASIGSFILYGDLYVDDDATFAEDVVVGRTLTAQNLVDQSLPSGSTGNFVTWNSNGKLIDSGKSQTTFDARYLNIDQQTTIVVTDLVADADYYNSSDGNWYSDSGFTTLATDNTSTIQDAIDSCPVGCNLLIPNGNIGVEDTLLIDKEMRLYIDGNLRVQGGFKPSTLMWYSEGKVRGDLLQVRSSDVTIYNNGTHFMNQEWAGTYNTGDTVDVKDDSSNLSGENGNQIYLNIVSLVGDLTFSGSEITSYSNADNFLCIGIRGEKTFNGVAVYGSNNFSIERTHTFDAPTHDVNYTNATVEVKFSDQGVVLHTIGEGTEEAIDFNPNVRDVSIDGVLGRECTQACIELNNAFGISVTNVLAINCFSGLKIQNYATGRNPEATYQNEGLSFANINIIYSDLVDTIPSFTDPIALEVQGCNTVTFANILINYRNDSTAVEALHAIHIHNVGTSSAQRRSRRIQMDGFIVRCSGQDALQNNGQWVLIEGDSDQVHMSNGLFELVGIEDGQTVIQVDDSNGGACDDIQIRDVEIRGSSVQPNTTGFLTDNNSTVNIIHPSFEDVNTETNLGSNTTYIPLVADHNDLNNLQGGTSGEYNHLTNSELALVQQLSNPTNLYVESFVDGDLASGVLTVTHNLGNQFVQVTVYDDSNQVIMPNNITATSTTQTTIDLSSFGTISGTWNVVIIG